MTPSAGEEELSSRLSPTEGEWVPMRKKIFLPLVLLLVAAAYLPSNPLRLLAQSTARIDDAVLGEPSPKTAEISTGEMRRVLADDNATVFDVRATHEFAISHIPGAVNVSQKPGTSKALYVSDVAEIEL
jgi:Rhodanese-like domain